MTAVFEPPGQQTFLLTKIDVNGQPYTVPNAGGFVYMYEPGSTVPRTTWLDSAQTTANTNPIRLDPDGRCAIFGTGEYRQIVTNANGDVQWDQLTELGIDETLASGLVSGGVPVLVDGPNPNPPLSTPDQGQRPLAAVLGSFVDARNGRFGALRQGGDDLVVIQAAINYAGSIGGATVYLGPGPLNTASGSQVVWPLSGNGVSLKGDGPSSTVVNVNGDMTQDVFVLSAGNLIDCQITDLGFSVNGSPTNGALIHSVNCARLLVDNVRMSNGFQTGVFVEGGANQGFVVVRNLICQFCPSSNACIQLGGDSTANAYSTVIDSCVLSAAEFGIVLRNASGVHVTDTVCLTHGNAGLATIPPPGITVRDVQITDANFEGCTNSGLYLGDAGGNSFFIVVANCWLVDNGIGVDIGLNPSENNISITGCQIHTSHQQGILNNGANGVLISGCLLAGNGFSAPNTYDAIAILGSSIQNVVSGNFVGAAFGVPAAHRYAVTLGGTADYCTVTGNVTGSGGTGSINNGSTGTHNVVANNTGT